MGKPSQSCVNWPFKFDSMRLLDDKQCIVKLSDGECLVDHLFLGIRAWQF